MLPILPPAAAHCQMMESRPDSRPTWWTCASANASFVPGACSIPFFYDQVGGLCRARNDYPLSGQQVRPDCIQNRCNSFLLQREGRKMKQLKYTLLGAAA